MRKTIALLSVFFFSLSCEKEPTFYVLNVSGNPSAGGRVSPSQGEYEEGTSVTISATPNTHYEFEAWSGGLTGTQPSATVTMDSDKNIVANFRLKDTDGDGVTDDVDQCPNTSTGEEVDFQGCSDSQKDSDSDGISDALDQCSNTRAGVPVDENGCMLSPVFLKENGVTVTCYDWSEIGDSAEINGATYTIVSEQQLREMIENNEDVTKTCTCKVQDIYNMFSQSSFNQDISHWDVSKITDMNYLFYDTPFNQPIGAWDVSEVTDMNGMFLDSSFNQPIGAWDVSKVTNMNGMFSDSSFNQPIGDWNVSNVEDMSYMFYETPFNQPIGDWNVSNTKMNNILV